MDITANTPIFKDPENIDTKVWRYMDFTSLVSMYEEKGLFFSRGSSFNDAFEGSLPLRNVHTRREVHRNHFLNPDSLRQDWESLPNVTWAPGAMEQQLELNKKRKEKLIEQYGEDKALEHWIGEGDSLVYWWNRQFSFINCWHASDSESAAMWELYGKDDKGIAIQTTFRKLRDSLKKNIWLSMVNYIDYEKDEIKIDLPPHAFFWFKRNSFSYEKEVRALFLSYEGSPGHSTISWDTPLLKGGKWVTVDLSMLIEKIYINPNAPLWHEALVKKVNNTYGYSFPVTQSDLAKDPVY
jgi:hypothetical protein